LEIKWGNDAAHFGDKVKGDALLGKLKVIILVRV
jgi:hypothetical protein